MDKQIGIIVQARMTSNRFPAKMLYHINRKQVILHTLDRLKELPFQTVIAIPDNERNQVLGDFLRDKGYNVFTGPEEDVLKRFLDCAIKYNFDPIIRICGDSPLIERDEIVRTLYKYETFGKGWLAVGLGVQIMSLKALEWADKHCKRMDLREHVWLPLEGSVNYPEDIETIERYLKETT